MEPPAHVAHILAQCVNSIAVQGSGNYSNQWIWMQWGDTEYSFATRSCRDNADEQRQRKLESGIVKVVGAAAGILLYFAMKDGYQAINKFFAPRVRAACSYVPRLPRAAFPVAGSMRTSARRRHSTSRRLILHEVASCSMTAAT